MTFMKQEMETMQLPLLSVTLVSLEKLEKIHQI